MINCIAYKFWFWAHLPQLILHRNTRTLCWKSPQKLRYAGRRKLSAKILWLLLWWWIEYGFPPMAFPPIAAHMTGILSLQLHQLCLLIFNTPTSLSVLVKLCHTVQDSKDPVCLSFSTWLSTAPSHSFLPSFIDLFFLFSNPHYIQRFSHRNSLLLGKNPARFSPACPAWDSKNCPGDVTCWK